MHQLRLLYGFVLQFLCVFTFTTQKSFGMQIYIGLYFLQVLLN